MRERAEPQRLRKALGPQAAELPIIEVARAAARPAPAAISLHCRCTVTLGTRHVPIAQLMLLSVSELALAPVRVGLALGEVTSGSTLLGGAIIIGAISYQALSGTRRPLAML